MAERYAVSAGNWVAARFDGGTLPGAGDTVHANGFAVTIDTSITVDALSTRAGSVAVAGGSFTTSGTVTVNADTYGGTTSCLTLTASSGSIQNGSSYGSLTTNNAAGSVVRRGTTQNGNAFGGNGSGRIGTDVDGGTLNGDVTGGTVVNGNGASIRNNGVLNGDSYGGTTSGAVGCTISLRSIQNGDSYASSSAHGSEITGGSIQNGNSYGGSGSNSRGSNLNASFHFGQATGGTGGSAYGSNLANGSIFFGSAVGAGPGGSNGNGLNVSQGSVAVVTGAQSTASNKAIRFEANTAVILQNGVTASDTVTTAAVGTYELATGSSPNYPFLTSGSAGFTGIRGTSRRLGT